MTTGTVRLHRVLRTKPAKIYKAFLDAAAIAKWLPPYGFVCKVEHMDTSALRCRSWQGPHYYRRTAPCRTRIGGLSKHPLGRGCTLGVGASKCRL